MRIRSVTRFCAILKGGDVIGRLPVRVTRWFSGGFGESPFFGKSDPGPAASGLV